MHTQENPATAAIDRLELLKSPVEKRLAELLASLVRARKQFDPSAADHGRTAIYQALLGVIGYVSDVIPARPDLVQPLHDLLYGLKDLDRGTVVPLLRPADIENRPPNSISQKLLRADAAVLMELMQMDKVERKQAADTVARRLERLGFRDGGKSISGKRVAYWRDKMKKPDGPSDVAVSRYVFALEALKAIYPNDPMSAFRFYIDCMADLDTPAIRKKGAQK